MLLRALGFLQFFLGAIVAGAQVAKMNALNFCTPWASDNGFEMYVLKIFGCN